MKGQLTLETLVSPALRGNPLGDPAERQIAVYYPPGYAQATERYPVVYFLHGFSGSVHGWLNTGSFSLRVPDRLDRLIESGAVPPVLGVFPDGFTTLGGAQWINSAASGNHGDYLSQDVVAWADRTLRTRPVAASRALVGHSSGGYGALAATARAPGIFGHVACHSGDAYFEYCYLPDFPKAAGALLAAGGVEPWWKGLLQRASETKLRGDDHTVLNVVAMAAAYSPDPTQPLRLQLPFEPETARLRPDVWAQWQAADPVRFVPRNLEAFRALRTLFIDCGRKDEFHLRWGARMLAETFRQAGIDARHEEFDDGHMGISYRYDAGLRAIGPRLA